jgi:hypothetical protein
VNIDNAFPSKYLRAADLGDAQPVVTIARVAVEAVGREQEQKPVVYFVDKAKGVVLNKTNSRAIAQIAGSSETDDWGGTQVQLYVATVEYSGESMEAIRIRAPKTTAKPRPAPVVAPPSDIPTDDIPF